ncbi:hypothetical protein T02_12859 [Trichinella nativa]|uniref:Uncharacterized protein n=1 Tax=Trichinella nativa TaxID=6335 RepID=A0A0V1KVP6_9BILA|nr:hypothetical protein T02_12859 [Trichinella nativa]
MRVGRQKPTAVLAGPGPAISNAAVQQWLLQQCLPDFLPIMSIFNN